MLLSLKALIQAILNFLGFQDGLLQPCHKCNTFSYLPTEILVDIARHCENSNLINLCLTSRRLNQICSPVLYRHVDLDIHRHMYDSRGGQHYEYMLATFKKQQQLVNTLLSHPQYGKYVRTFRGTLYTPVFNFCEGDDIVSEEELWRAIESLTHVQSVIAGSRNRCISPLTELRTQIPGSLFQSATSVTLVGEIQYELAKSILCGINPATLMHLSLDVVQDRSLKYFGSEVSEQLPGDIGEDGRIIAYGALSGLLTPLTGHCTALGTLILRRVEQIEKCPRWHAAAEAASYMESAAFIDSVRSTVQSLTWEQVEDTKFTPGPNSDRVVDKSFQRLILPTIVSGTWPCLTKIRLRGVSSSDEQGGTDGLITQLRAVLSGSTTIEVSGEGESKQAF